MVDTVCPFCQNTGFELHSETVLGLASELPVLQCSACGAPVSVLQGVELRQALSQQEQRLRELGQLVSEMYTHIADIERHMTRLSQASAAS
jgi:hypothetical protein